jgi:Uma2 family endonuclease
MIVKTQGWTIQDLDALPDDGGWTRYEIIDGELFVTRAPHLGHQGASGNLHFELESWSRQTKRGRAFQAPGVVFSGVDAVIPDVVWASQACLAQAVDDAGHFTLAPELVVEVLSLGERNQKRDRQEKLKLYSQYGVQEDWLVDWRSQRIEIYRRRETAELLQRVKTLGGGDTLTSPLLPGFVVAVAQVFGE